MKALRVYLDTSVFGGCFDKEFATDSNRVMQGVNDGYLTALISETVVGELVEAPLQVLNVLNSMPPETFERVDITDNVYDLQKAYLDAGILGPRWSDDLLHVAAATVARADAIISWNFKHIVRLDKIKAYNRINFEMGYGIITILSPREVRFNEPEE